MNMEEKFLIDLLDNSRLLTVLHDNLPVEIKKDQLYTDVTAYLEKYAAFNNISPGEAVGIYTKFIVEFNKNCKQFAKSGKYPFEYGAASYTVSREEYDIVLLMSVLFSQHRFRIIQVLSRENAAGKGLFIGLGPGLELTLTKTYLTETTAYDLSVNKFLFSEFPDCSIHTELYTGQKQDHFDAIYLVELLEHLENPYSLLEVCYRSLKKGGKIFLTTATDIPQFDHLYNFPADHTGFEKKVSALGFSVVYKEMIPHNYLTMDIRPCNHFYILERC